MPLTHPKPTSLDYELLGVAPDVTALLLKKAYREKVKLWHPDRFQHRGDYDRQAAEEQFKAINRAYHNILADLGQNQLEDPNGNPVEEEGRRNGVRAEKPVDAQKSQAPQEAFVKREGGAWRWGKILAGGEIGHHFFLALRRSLRRKGGRVCLVAVVAGIFLAVNWSAIFEDNTEKAMKSTPGPYSLKRRMIVTKPAEEEAGGEEDRLSALGASEGATKDTVLKAREPSPGYFSIGSNPHQVLAAQGKPSRVKGKTWFYNLSEITFKDGRVERYDNFDGSLRVRMAPDKGIHAEDKPFITLGSTRDDVLRAQGTPTRVLGNRWYYGFSELRFKDGRVESFDNFFGNLEIRMTPSAAFLAREQPRFFSLGSTKDEVLAVQGTPSSIQAGLWSYGSASIQFREDRVQSVFGETATLRFVSPEDMAAGE